jgi:hypothetical protein
MEFPLLDRELTRQARRKSTHGVRLTAPVLALGAIALFWMYSGLVSGMGVIRDDTLGQMFLWVATTFQYFVLFLGIPLMTAASIAQEKEERTLGLLLLADRGIADLYASKFAAVLVPATLLLLSVLPILAFASFFGAVAVPAMILNLVLLSTAAIVVTALGLLASTLSRTPRQALSTCFGFIILWLVAVAIIEAMAFLPFPLNLFHTTARVEFILPTPMQWAPAIITAVLFALATAKITTALLPRQADEKHTKRVFKPARRVPGKGNYLTMSVADRIVMASSKGVIQSISFWPLRAVASVGLMIASLLATGFFSCFGMLFIPAIAMYDITSSIAASVKSGTLEDLLLTPIDDADLGQAIIRAHFRRNWVYFPALAMAGGMYSVMLISMLTTMSAGPSGASPIFSFLPYLVLIALTSIAFIISGTVHYMLVISLGCSLSTEKGDPIIQSLKGVGAYFGWSILLSIIPAFIAWLAFLFISESGIPGSYKVSPLASQFIKVIAAITMYFTVIAMQWKLYRHYHNRFQDRISTVFRYGGGVPRPPAT